MRLCEEFRIWPFVYIVYKLTNYYKFALVRWFKRRVQNTSKEYFEFSEKFAFRCLEQCSLIVMLDYFGDSWNSTNSVRNQDTVYSVIESRTLFSFFHFLGEIVFKQDSI